MSLGLTGLDKWLRRKLPFTYLGPRTVFLSLLGLIHHALLPLLLIITIHPSVPWTLRCHFGGSEISNLIASGGIYGNCGIWGHCLVLEIHRTHVDIIQMFCVFVWTIIVCLRVRPRSTIHIYRRTTCSRMVSLSASWTNYRYKPASMHGLTSPHMAQTFFLFGYKSTYFVANYFGCRSR